MDNSFYVIKKIKIKIDEKNLELQKDISTVLQEIRYLARLKSEYIVTYNHSWVEVNLKEAKQTKTDTRFKFQIEDEDGEEDDDDKYVFNRMRKDVDDSVGYSSRDDSNSSIEFYCSEKEDKKAKFNDKKMTKEKNKKT